MNEIQNTLHKLFKNWAGERVLEATVLPASGSQRQYARLRGETRVAMGVYNPNAVENKTFLAYTEHFLRHQVAVPRVYGADLSVGVYLLEDLGDLTLLEYINHHRDEATLRTCYQEALRQLAHLQLFAAADLDYSVSQAHSQFDKTAMRWDLSYFKYCFVLSAYLPMDEYKLEADFERLLHALDEVPQGFFMYRDFQARNIMLANNKLYFIDYQGAKQGALQYDVASLLYQAKADLPDALREELLDFYIQLIQQHLTIDPSEFKQQYYRFVLLRMLQVLGSYGFRGFYERKAHFLDSLPYALQTIQKLMTHHTYLFNQLPELSQILRAAIAKYGTNLAQK